MARCDSCRFWSDEVHRSEWPADDQEGECRRHAPRPQSSGYGYQLTHLVALLAMRDFPQDVKFPEWEEFNALTFWPMTWGGDFCGEYEATATVE